tara:strand:+ start:415 stop:525 length:111 start_codon:yes stop_codon:yes gene_type:complete
MMTNKNFIKHNQVPMPRWKSLNEVQVVPGFDYVAML